MISQSNKKLNDIFSAATKLFAENGFDATPTAAIAAEAGVANGTLFHYFRTKDELITALYGEIRKEMLGEAVSGLSESQPFFSSLHTMWDALISWALANQNAAKFLIQFEASPIYFREQNKSDKLSEVIEIFIKIGINSRELLQIPAVIIKQQIIGQLMTFIKDLLLHPELANDIAYREASLHLVQRAIKAEKN